jgi:hypothetical protein
VPKRKVKEQKPAKRLSKKEVLIAPVAMGASLLVALVIIPHFAPPPIPTKVCLKGQGADTFNVYPAVQIIVDGKQKLLPSGLGKSMTGGKECLHVIHTDNVGNRVHIEYVRPIRLSMADFMKIYSPNNRTIVVIDNSTGNMQQQVIPLEKYNIQYSYYSERGFSKVEKPSDMPPFTDNMVARVQLIPK